MTARDLWEGLLTETSKANAPSLLLEDFNYYVNKAINQYINKKYNIYDLNQQTTDDLRVLKSTAILKAEKSADINPALAALKDLGAGKSKLFGATYEVNLPSDYLHLLNCVCIYKIAKSIKCYNAGDDVAFPAKRLTADSWSVIVNDYYNRPLPQRPYFYIHNVNVNEEVPTNPVTYSDGQYKGGTDSSYNVTYPNTIIAKYEGELPVKFILADRELTIFEPDSEYTLQKFTFDDKVYYGVTFKVANPELIKEVAPRTISLINKLPSTITQNYTGYAFVEANKVNGEWKFTNIQRGLTQQAISSPKDIVDKTEYANEVINSVISPKIEFVYEASLPRTVQLNNGVEIPNVNSEKVAELRYGNPSKVRLEIRYGHDDSVFQLLTVLVDYIKSPQYIRLTLEQINLTEDTSLILEFSDNTCSEIMNELVILVMAANSDPRLLTHVAVSNSIANPVQQLASAQKA